MATPKRKTTPSRRGMRRAHDRLKQVLIAFDSNTGEPKRSHHMSADGMYKGIVIKAPKVKRKKTEDSE